MKCQDKALDLARQELASLQNGSEVLQLKNDLITSQRESKEFEQELSKERKENTVRLKEKDNNNIANTTVQ